MKAAKDNLPDILLKLADVRAMLKCPWGESEVLGQELLRQRAARLEQVEPSVDESVETLEMLKFLVGDEHYGVEACYVERVMRWSACVHLPGGPGCLLGIMDVNGETLAIFESYQLFALTGAGPPPESKLIVMCHGANRFGLRMDAVEGMFGLDRRDLRTVPLTLPPERASLLCGVTQGGVIVLDGEKLLKDPGLKIHQNA
jgi:purine-binding chemotaxis protein CheW